jgi:hypothetical protein
VTLPPADSIFLRQVHDGDLACSSCFPKCEIVAYTPGPQMFSVWQRNDAVVTQSRRTSPDDYISMYDLDALSSFRALQPTEKERRGQP